MNKKFWPIRGTFPKTNIKLIEFFFVVNYSCDQGHHEISNVSPGLIDIDEHILGVLLTGGAALYSRGLYSEDILC